MGGRLNGWGVQDKDESEDSGVIDLVRYVYLQLGKANCLTVLDSRKLGTVRLATLRKRETSDRGCLFYKERNYEPAIAR